MARGQGECHEEVQEGAFCYSLGDPVAWIQEGGEACSSPDRVLAGADVAGGKVVEEESQAFPHRLQKEPGCVQGGSFDVKGGDDEVYRVHVGDGVLEMASCGDRPGMAPPRLAGMLGSRWRQMRRRRTVQTIWTSVTVQTMGRQLSGLAQSRFL